MRKRNLKKSGKKTCSVIVEGETELWYLQALKDSGDFNKFDIKPELPKKKELFEQFDLVIENAKHYDQVYWIIDLDTIIAESKVTKKGQETKLDKLNKYKKKIEGIRNVEVIINNPSLEYWFLLHFKKTNKYYSKSKDVEKILKKDYLKGYEKTRKYYKPKGSSIYEKLKDKTSEAVKNGEAIGPYNKEEFEKGYSEFYKFINEMKNAT